MFENILKRQFTVPLPDKFWCADFTYIPLSDGSMRYNCTIIDLYDRSVIASVSGRNKMYPKIKKYGIIETRKKAEQEKK